MMLPDNDEIRRKVKMWLNIADEDLRLAQHGMNMSTSVPFRLIAYHAQQCAEKCLKAYLVSKLVDFPYTHNIGFLLELIQTKADWVPNLDMAKVLTSYAITTRYPGFYEDFTESEVLEAIKIAQQVKQTIVNKLDEEGYLISI